MNSKKGDGKLTSTSKERATQEQVAKEISTKIETCSHIEEEYEQLIELFDREKGRMNENRRKELLQMLVHNYRKGIQQEFQYLPQSASYLTQKTETSMIECLNDLLKETEGLLGFPASEIRSGITKPIEAINADLYQMNLTNSKQWCKKVLEQLKEVMYKSLFHGGYESWNAQSGSNQASNYPVPPPSSQQSNLGSVQPPKSMMEEVNISDYLKELNVVVYQYLILSRGPEKFKVLRQFLEEQQFSLFRRISSSPSESEKRLKKQFDLMLDSILIHSIFHHEQCSYEYGAGEKQLFLALYEEAHTAESEDHDDLKNRYKQIMFEEQKWCQYEASATTKMMKLKTNIEHLLQQKREKMNQLEIMIQSLSNYLEEERMKLEEIEEPPQFTVKLPKKTLDHLSSLYSDSSKQETSFEKGVAAVEVEDSSKTDAETLSSEEQDFIKKIRSTSQKLANIAPRRLSTPGLYGEQENISSSFS